jgi:hypothetical protein
MLATANELVWSITFKISNPISSQGLHGHPTFQFNVQLIMSNILSNYCVPLIDANSVHFAQG